MDATTPAEAFPLRDHLSDELRSRGWSAAHLASLVAIRADRLEEILCRADPRLSAEEAAELGRAFGVAPEVLLNLEVAYRRHVERLHTL